MQELGMYQAFYEVSNNTQQFISRCIGGIHKSSSFNYSNYGVSVGTSIQQQSQSPCIAPLTTLFATQLFYQLEWLKPLAKKNKSYLVQQLKNQVHHSDLTIYLYATKLHRSKNPLVKMREIGGLEKMTNEPKNKGDESRWGT